MKKKRFILLFTILLLIGGLMYYMGVFARVHIMEKDMGPYVLVYKEIKGDNKVTKETIEEITKELQKEGITPYRGYSYYYDDPKTPEKETNLSNEAGCVLKQEDAGKLDTTRFKIKEFPKQHCVVSNFRYKIGLSVMLGKMKVYPALEVYIKEKGYKTNPVMEQYGPKSITYIIPVK
jgi:effector-binding domain-containing protein